MQGPAACTDLHGFVLRREHDQTDGGNRGLLRGGPTGERESCVADETPPGFEPTQKRPPTTTGAAARPVGDSDWRASAERTRIPSSRA
jgi:hypothetical protein